MKALFAGSFDPPHSGHLDLARRAARLFDQLVVGVATNPEKKPFLPATTRVEILQAELGGQRGVQVLGVAGATAMWARANGVQVLVRGLRSSADLPHEQAMATVHKGLGLDTVFLATDPTLAHISSGLIRQLLGAGLPLDGLLPSRAADAIRRWQA